MVITHDAGIPIPSNQTSHVLTTELQPPLTKQAIPMLLALNVYKNEIH